jgi:hypothetical protein
VSGFAADYLGDFLAVGTVFYDVFGYVHAGFFDDA